jgi:Spy/CpxP family protein refolding chaperone
MKTLSAVLTLLGVMWVCPSLFADDEATARQTSVGSAERIQDLNLTDEQESRIADIRKECQPKVQEAARELAALVQDEEGQIRAVLTDAQREKLQAFKEERKEHRMEGLCERMAHLRDLDLTEDERTKIQEIRNEYHPRIAKAVESLHGILTDDQRRTREEGLKAGKPHREVLASLDLTAEQKEKVADACKNACTIVREELEKIRDVLTAEQRAQLPELRHERMDRVRDKWACRVANFRELNLTDEQRTKIEDIRKEFRPKIHEAGNKFRAAVRDEVGMVLAVFKQ